MRRISDTALAEFFDDLTNMLVAGVGVPHILAALKETAMNNNLVKVIRQMENETRQGQTLAQSMSAAGAFPWLAWTTVQAGENSGQLAQSTAMLAQYFRHRGDMNKKMAHAFIYPAVVLVLLCGVMFFMALHVVPRLKNLLPADTFDHGITRWILGSSGFLQQFWPACLAAAAAMAAGAFWCSSQRPKDLERFMCRVPVLGILFKESALAMYFFNLSVLLKSGVALMRAIHDLNAVHSSEASRRVFDCREYMFGGLSFWESIRTDPFFPSAAVFTLRRGEEMARLDEYCSQLAQYFDKRVSMRLEVLAQLVQPALLAMGGLFLAVIAFAFLMPIYGGLTRIAGG